MPAGAPQDRHRTGAFLQRLPELPHGKDEGGSRQFLHCQWAPDARGVVGLSDDKGLFQLLQLGTNESKYYRVGFSAVQFPPAAPLDEQDGLMWDTRPWSQFGFVPESDGELVFIQWQSDAVLLARPSAADDHHRDGQEIVLLGRHQQRVRAITVDEGGEHAASGSDDGVVVLWKLQNLAEHRRHAQAHSGPVTALRFLGNSLFSAGSDQHLKWWDVPSGDVVADFVMHASPVLDLATAVGPAGSAGYRPGLLFGGHADGTLSTWSLETRSLVCSAQCRGSALLTATASSSCSHGNLVVTGGLDGVLLVHRIGGGSAAAVQLLGSYLLGSAVVCSSFQPLDDRDHHRDDADSSAEQQQQQLCICCRDSVQAVSIEHVLSRIQQEPSAAGAQSDDAQTAVSEPPDERPFVDEERARSGWQLGAPEEGAEEAPLSAESEWMQPITHVQEAMRLVDANAGELRHVEEPSSWPVHSTVPPVLRDPDALAGPAGGDFDGQPFDDQDTARTAVCASASPGAGAASGSYKRHPALAARLARRGHTQTMMVAGGAANANYGDPLKFAAVLSSSRANGASADDPPHGELGLRTQPVLNSSTRLAAKLAQVQQERFPAAAAEAARAAAAAARTSSLVNFSREDRKYAALPALDVPPEDPKCAGLKIIPKQLNEQWLRGLELKPDIRSLFHRDCELEYMAPSSTAKMLLASTKRPLREQFLGL